MDMVHQLMKNDLQKNFDQMLKRMDHNLLKNFLAILEEVEELIEMVMMKNCRTYFFLKHHDEFIEYDQMICTSMNKNKKRREKKNWPLTVFVRGRTG